ncbi:helix-turn-helix transcriptional regulator [Microbacterium sp.]|uniref:helix-turn-helix transcriptional regulator n=1 Tax=Microbacterium sp. TaxID=51671 RepID=UPI003F72D432
MTTTARLLSLLSLLQTRREWPGATLAERLDVSHRTVRRDVDRLREMGYSIRATMGPTGGYRLDAGAELPPLLFDDDQIVALAVALRAAATTGADVGEGALRALTTVRQVMPPRLRHRIDAIEFTSLTESTSTDADVLIELSSVVRAREVLRFDYTNSEGATSRHRAEPHHLVTAGGRWYLVAWDLDRDDWRLFRADRLTPRPPHGPRFAPRELPGGTAAAFVSARFKGSETDAWPCIGTVELHLPVSAVVPFAGDGVVEAVDANRCRFTSGAWSWAALAASLNRFDADIDVIGPPDLVDAFATLAARNARSALLPRE